MELGRALGLQWSRKSWVAVALPALEVACSGTCLSRSVRAVEGAAVGREVVGVRARAKAFGGQRTAGGLVAGGAPFRD